ncbi:flagellar motor protein MotB [Caenispirillum bisanense]|uniref:Chemotaxis protein MotB n=1 Tax=Caenispirillum bisanense TaxID=414052 RepID=A0A286GFQ7_9PROT|nr:flagellar motor protein MotB [Caenispirillum bisanense]SOD94320.1 chemotaxis protein MotB [Caenispirillum bisanense]
MAEERNVTIIKRIKKGGAAHHGGAWKVAYADFVTAMMAFFLLLWLLNAVTEEQLQGISNYFSPVTVSQSPSGAGGMLGGQVIGEGASSNNSGSPIAMTLPPPTIGQGGDDFTDPKEGRTDQDVDDFVSGTQASKAEAERRQAEEMGKVEDELRAAMQSVPDLAKMAPNLVVDQTPEGLRIQIVDNEGRSMFPAGGAGMFPQTKALLELVANVVKRLPYQIAVDGHTDGTPFNDQGGYGNWELSADRALAARRVLSNAGVPEDQVNRVTGKASSELLVDDQPDNPRNRRISIILLRDRPTDEAPAETPANDRMPSIIRGR